jgi:hypothetical protein
VEKDIEAVKFILACFYYCPHDKENRDKLIREKLLENDMIAVYGRHSEDELKGILPGLQGQVTAGKYWWDVFCVQKQFCTSATLFLHIL